MSTALTTLALALAALPTLRLALIVLGAAWHARRPAPPPVALPHLDVLVPAFNESLVLERTVRSLLHSDHPDLRVLVIDDGSEDGTGAIARALAADPRVRAICLPRNGGKAAALNAGLDHATGPHLATVDADTQVSAAALRLLTTRLCEPGVAAAAANVKVGNRERWITRMQSLEYIAALQLDRRAQDVIGCITTVPGAAAAFRLSAVREVGGYSGETRTEDTDLTLSLLRAGHRVVFEPRAHALTEAPQSLTALLRQRVRWIAGFAQCTWKHRAALLRPTVLGWIGLPNLLYTQLVVLLLPLPALLGAAWTGAYTTKGTIAAIGSVVAVQTALAAWAVWLDRERARDLPLLPVQLTLWPVLLLTASLLAWSRLLVGAQVPWSSPARHGTVPAPR